ncbi:ribonuclease D [Xenococcus sp. PCC 7305]|uniref:ribonuclease D n=1 Tax=Xenococcus sp. PCC 7305 TaxID=102125 RepID=UPI0002ABDBDC|nr:ribonuclease D [Xenococcus sp. PCC 7305]ELS03596.1 ribonuclease D [Xenococcus sp. PCC 7305]
MILDNFKICEGDLDNASMARYLAADAIAIDTETMGLVIGRDRLCLVQLCDPQGYVTAVRIEQGQTSAPNLKRILEDPEITKVFHFARFDVAQFRYTFGVETAPIFCTKIASKLARTYTSSHGLKSLVMELTGTELDKSAQSSDWGDIDSLSVEQLNYAANDVRYLIDAQTKLTDMLKRENRWELAQECFKCIPVFVSLDIMRYENIFEH